MANRRRKSKSSNALPLIIVGTGLILLAIAGAFLRPKLTSSAADSSAGSSGASSIPAAVNYPAPELIRADVILAAVSCWSTTGLPGARPAAPKCPN